MKKRGREKRGMKKALAGPARRAAKKKPERRAMIAAAGRRIRLAKNRLRCSFSALWTGKAQRNVVKALLAVPAGALAISRRVDQDMDRLLQRTHPQLVRAGRKGRAVAATAARRARPAGVFLLRRLSWLERRLLRGRDVAARAATRASAVLTPQRAICLAILAAAACLGASQFAEYRAVEIGQPGYAGLPDGASAPPTVAGEDAGAAHAYLLLPVAVLAALLALVVLRNGARRGLGRIVFALGALALAVGLLVDLPAGLDAGAEQARFAGATAVLQNGFYAQVASAVGLMISGLILAGRHRYRLRKPSMARTQGGRRRERTVSA